MDSACCITASLLLRLCSDESPASFVSSIQISTNASPNLAHVGSSAAITLGCISVTARTALNWKLMGALV